MKCPSCAAADLVQDTRDMPHTYKGESTIIPAVTGDFCPACGQAVLDMAESTRTSAAMGDFNKQVNASMQKMVVFLDTEFTDFIDCELISIGMVSEDGTHEFYAERTDYPDDWCSDFVREAVLPHLGKIPGSGCGREELRRRLWNWFATLPPHVQIATESAHDRDLLWDAFGEGLPANLDPAVLDLRPLIDTAVFNEAVCRYHAVPGQPWHHAMHDARANRLGWLVWADDAKKAQRS